MATIVTSKLRKAIYSLEDIMPFQVINKVLQVVGCVKIHFKKDEVSFEGRDSSITRLKLKVVSYDNPSQGACISVPCKAFIQLLDEIPDDKVTLTCDDEINLKVKYGETVRVIPGVHDDSPEWERHNSETFQGEFWVKKKSLRDAVDACCPYVNSPALGEELMGINFRWDGSKAIAEATNKTTFIQVAFPVVSESPAFSFMIPSPFLVKLLSLRWEELKISAYGDRIMATNENGTLTIARKTILNSYHLLETARKEVIADAVVSKISTEELSNLLVPIQRSHAYITIIGENKSLHICAISYDKFKQKSLTKDEGAFAWASLKMDLLLHVCASAGNAKEILVHIAKPRKEIDAVTDDSICQDGESKLLPVIFEYALRDCSYTIGVMQLMYRKDSFQLRTQEMLIERYSPKTDEAIIAVEVTAQDDEGVFDVPDDIFPDGFFNPGNDDDRPDGDVESAEELYAS